MDRATGKSLGNGDVGTSARGGSGALVRGLGPGVRCGGGRST